MSIELIIKIYKLELEIFAFRNNFHLYMVFVFHTVMLYYYALVLLILNHFKMQ
jgi:hypothetical protein